DIATDGLFDLLSYLLINYFERYEFGSNTSVMFSFSILPPIIRYKVLIFLYEKYPNNISIIDKLVLSILKTCDIESVIDCHEEQNVFLLLMNAYTDDLIFNIYFICSKDSLFISIHSIAVSISQAFNIDSTNLSMIEE